MRCPKGLFIVGSSSRRTRFAAPCWHATWLESFDQIFEILAIFVVRSEEVEVNHGLHELYGF